MNRAKMFANAYAKNATESRTAHLYRDGIVLAIPVRVDTHLTILSLLKMVYERIETARSDDGMFVAFVLDIDADNADGAYAFTSGYVDHRQDKRCNTIKQMTALLQRKLDRDEEI